MHKLGAHRKTEGAFYEEFPFKYDNIFCREKTTGPERLLIAPSAGHISILIDLATAWNGDYWLLYILMISRCGNEAARYQSPGPVDFDALQSFLYKFGHYLSTDGRHHFWIGSIQNEGMLIYDQHDVIYAYGDLDAYEAKLVQRGLTIASVTFPSPHTHCYNAENDADESRILQHFDWIKSPLRDSDDY